jgi:hypothetical protein
LRRYSEWFVLSTSTQALAGSAGSAGTLEVSVSVGGATWLVGAGAGWA